MQTDLSYTCQSIGYHFPADLLYPEQSLQIGEVSGLAGLIDSIDIAAEPAAVVEY